MNYTIPSCYCSWCCGVIESSWGGVLVGVVVGCMVKMHHFSVVGLYVDIHLESHNSFALVGAHAPECLYIQLVRAYALEC